MKEMIETLSLNTESTTAEADAQSLPETDMEAQRARVHDLLEHTAQGGTASSINNCVLVLENDPLLKGALRMDLLTERIDVVKPLGWTRGSSVLTDMDVHYLKLYFEKHYGLSSEKKLQSALHIVANENGYHPIREKLNSLVWDGTSRIRGCLRHFLGANADDYTEAMLTHFLLGAILRVFQPGCKYEEILCLVGGQGIGKSTFFRFLAIQDDWFSDDIRHLDDDKVFQRLQGHWIIEMSEMLATNNAKSVEESRSFFSRQKDTYRVPYESQPKDRPRQCVFGGTSNSMDFLPLDRAGNRRFLPIVTEIVAPEVHILEDEEASRAYLLQVWAEAMTIYRSGKYSMKFSKEIRTKLLDTQKDCMPEYQMSGMILGYLESFQGNIVCCRQLFEEALRRYDEPKKWELHEISEIMRNYAKEEWRAFPNPRQFGVRYGKQKGWERIPNTEDVKPSIGIAGKQVAGNQLSFSIIPPEEAAAFDFPQEWLTEKGA